jgi:hypothetical protein
MVNNGVSNCTNGDVEKSEVGFPENCVNGGGRIFIKSAQIKGLTPYEWCKLKNVCSAQAQSECQNHWR